MLKEYNNQMQCTHIILILVEKLAKKKKTILEQMGKFELGLDIIWY